MFSSSDWLLSRRDRDSTGAALLCARYSAVRCGHQCPERRAALDETQEREEHAHDDAVVRLAREPGGTSHRRIAHIVQEREEERRHAEEEVHDGEGPTSMTERGGVDAEGAW